MHIEKWQLAMALVASSLQLALLCILLVRGHFPSWPSLCVSLTVDISTSCILLWLARPGHYATYFYLYWGTSAAQSLLRLWVAVDIVRAFRFVDYLPTWAYWATALLALTLAVASGTLSQHDAFSFHHIVKPVLLLNRSVSFAWSTFLLVLLSCIRLAGIGWEKLGWIVMAGTTAHILAGVISAEALAQRTHRSTMAAGSIEALCEIAILTFWVISFLQTKPQSEAR